jgi:predicted methyltransferase
MNALKLIVCALLLPGLGVAAESWQAVDLQQALQVESRSAADQARDAGRKPAQVIELLAVAPGMTVLDVMAASGYYTEVLSIAVGPDGTVYAQNPQWMLEFMKGVVDKALSQRLIDDRLPNVVRVDGDLEQFGIADNSIDGAISALNFHDVYNDYGPDAALTLLQQVYAALKPGAAFVLIDHAGNPGLDNKALHRIPESDVRELALDAGFTIDVAPTWLSNPADDRTQMVFAKGLRGNTDRFVLHLRK